jgi:uncharacterized protein YaaQ
MSIQTEVKGDKLIITIDTSGKPYQSNSALAKALEKGLKPETVPATMVASTGGFTRVGAFKVSANVTLA